MTELNSKDNFTKSQTYQDELSLTYKKTVNEKERGSDS